MRIPYQNIILIENKSWLQLQQNNTQWPSLHFSCYLSRFQSKLILLLSSIFIFQKMSESIKVLVRIRPLSNSEVDRGCKTIVSVDQDNNQINLTKPDQSDNVKSFAYDAVFSETSQQALVYSKAAFALVQHVFEGYNGTVFAYGQTGCGKTHSMVGVPSSAQLQGIIPRCFGHVLQKMSQMLDKQFLLRCSFLEIYNEEVHDLLGDPKIKLDLKQSPEKGVFVKDLTLKQAKNHKELMDYLNTGSKNRAVGETAMNKDSSRSHLILSLHLQSATGEPADRKYMASRLNLVDLAGSEKLSKTGATGARMKEGQKINLSLSALGNVISALVQGRSQHIPYRDSKLTRLLQDSLGGNTKTVMLANCSPADYNFEQTLSTLRYASRAKLIKNKPIVNQDPKDALLKQYANQIQKLKSQLQGNTNGSNEFPQLHQKLKEKEVQLQNQKNEKIALLKKIQELQSRHIQAKDVNVDEQILQNVKRASLLLKNRSKAKLKTSIKIQTPAEQLKNKSNFTFNSTKKGEKEVKQLKSKITQLNRQLRDIQHQNYLEKQCLLEDFRQLSKQNKFLQSVLSVLLQNHEIQQIRQSSTYNQQKDEYRVPPFYFKNKQLIFPKLIQQQSMEMIRQKQQGRQIRMQPQKENFQVKSTNNSEIMEVRKKKGNNFGISDILKEARDYGQTSIQQERKVNRKVILNPILKI